MSETGEEIKPQIPTYVNKESLLSRLNPVNFLRRHSRRATVENIKNFQEKRRLAVKAHDKQVEIEEVRSELQQTETDKLTGLLTRDATFKKLEEKLAEALRSGIPLTAIYLDSNDLKYFNDEISHEAGNEMLAFVGNTINEEVREVDIAGRIGGDEMLILLYNMKAEDSVTFWERIKNKLDSKDLYGRRIRVSAGAAQIELKPGMTIEDALRNSEVAMYFSKNTSKKNNSQPELVLFNTLSDEQRNNIQNIRQEAEVRAPLGQAA